MAGRERDWDDHEGSPDPETLYTKEFCIGSFCHMSARSLCTLQGTHFEEEGGEELSEEETGDRHSRTGTLR